MAEAFGDCVVESERHPLDGWKLRVVHAAPAVLVDVGVLAIIAANPPEHPVQYDGKYLRIRGDNCTVVYRVGEYLPDRHAYAARWPD
jgi:hypothetical protein